jgi:hypothetical protein
MLCSTYTTFSKRTVLKNMFVRIDFSDKDDKIASDVGDCKRVRRCGSICEREQDKDVREQRFYRFGYASCTHRKVLS